MAGHQPPGRDTTPCKIPSSTGSCLGLNTSWTVTRVELNVKGQRVEVWAGHADSVRWPCPGCATDLALYDHGEERTWRHLDSCQFQTYLHARPPRVACPEHGVRHVRLPWAEPRGRFTTLFERLAIDVLRETDVKGATRILGISWDEAWEISVLTATLVAPRVTPAASLNRTCPFGWPA
jgi:transposase